MSPTRPQSWLESGGHRHWLLGEAARLIDFFKPACQDPEGGFFELGSDGRPQPIPAKEVVVTARMVHCFSLAHLLGHPGAGVLADHGLAFLESAHRDPEHGGYWWTVDHSRPVDTTKRAYGHAHVLLGASSALLAGRPGAETTFAAVTRAIDEHFWSERDGLSVEEYQTDWSQLASYRGQNSNMHLAEALLVAHEASGERIHLERARSIATRLIGEQARTHAWRIPEHYDARWHVDPEYNRDDPEHVYRPYGTTPGHSLEWARLLLQLVGLLGHDDGWMVDAARRLFARAVEDAWPARGGLFYTVGLDGRPLNRDRYWWVMAEALGAASYLTRVTGEPAYERRYREFWDWVDAHLIDREHGAWRFVLDDELQPKGRPWTGKHDLYHLLHACLLPLLPVGRGPAAALRAGALSTDGDTLSTGDGALSSDGDTLSTGDGALER
ncbi:MAG: AGE family epimerase/isomerase [Candidatus Dormibacteraceae bacterium]